MKKFLMLGSFLVLIQSVFAQNYNHDSKSILLKIAPFKTIGFENLLSLSAERRFTDKLSFQLQTDYIFFSVIGTSSSVENKLDKGFRIIPELRYYYHDADKMTPFYFGAQFMYKYLRTTQDEYRSFTDGAGQSYLQLLNNKKDKQIFATHFLVGWLFYLSPEKRTSIDLNFGFGARLRKVNTSLAPLDNGVFTIDTDANIGMPSATCNLKFCYSIFR